MDRYDKIREIGRGAQGTVNLVKDKNNGRRYVVKEIPINILSEEEKESTLRESQFLKSLSHPNIVEYVDSFLEKDFMYMTMTYCAGGDLNMHIRKKTKDGGLFEETQVLDWFVQICGAMAFVHGRHILHRDLKTNNVFLTDRNVVKLGDFGIARILENTLEKADTVVGTPFYMSPEVCENNPYDYKSDVWAMGCILYEMCTLKHAFKANNLLGIVFKIVQGEYAPVPDEYSAGLRALVGRLLSKDPEQRPTVAGVLASAFITEHIDVFMRTGGGTMGKEVPQLVRRAKELGEHRRRAREAAEAKGGGLPPGRLTKGASRRGMQEKEDNLSNLPHTEKLRRLKEQRLAKEEARRKAELERAYLESANGRQQAKDRHQTEFGTASGRQGTAPARHDRRGPGGGGDTFASGAGGGLLAGDDTFASSKDFEDTFQTRASQPYDKSYPGIGGSTQASESFLFAEAKSPGGGLQYSDDEDDDDDALETSMEATSHLVEPRSPPRRPLPAVDERPITASGGYDLDKYYPPDEEDDDAEDPDAPWNQVEDDDDVRADEAGFPGAGGEGGGGGGGGGGGYSDDDSAYSDDFASEDEHDYTIRPATSEVNIHDREEEHSQEMAAVLQALGAAGAASENGPTPPASMRAQTPGPRNAAAKDALAARVRDGRRRNIENIRTRLITELGRARFQATYDFFRGAHADGAQVSRAEVLRQVGGNRELVKKAYDVESLICLEELYCQS